MHNFIIIIVSSLCIIVGAIVKLSNIDNVYANVLFMIGLVGIIFSLILLIKNKLHKRK